MRAHIPKSSPRRAGILLAAAILAGLGVTAGSALAATPSSGSMSSASMSAMSSSRAQIGTTKGWLDGKTVTFLYTKNFFCRQPPASQAKSKCELGSAYDAAPATTFDPLYVIVPLGFTPPKKTLQCPTAGHCVDHPRTIDLSAVFGSGTGDALLPPHSHVVRTANGNKPEWWDVVVIGVKSLKSWDAIVHARNYAELQSLRARGDSAITNNLDTNLFLYFAVEKPSS